MRVWLFALLLSAGCFAFGQTPDTITITHKYYSITFSALMTVLEKKGLVSKDEVLATVGVPERFGIRK